MNLAHTIGWTLVHSLWEIGVIAVVLFLLCLCLKHASAHIRYLAAVVSLFLCFICPLGTLAFLAPGPTPPVTVAAKAPAQVAKLHTSAPVSAAVVMPPSAPLTLSQKIEPWLPALAIGWLIGLALMTLRLMGGLVAVERLRRRASPDVDERWSRLSQSLCDRLGVRRDVELNLSTSIETPAVLGVLKAVILFPASAISTLSTEHIEALLAHELAHVRRHDYLVNLLQSVIETALFYHPAIWWISSVVRSEREHCCDDLAVLAVGNRESYARALIGLEALRSAPHLAMAANRSSLVFRIRRILMKPQQKVVPSSVWETLVFVLVVSLGLAQTLHATHQRREVGPASHIASRVLAADGKPAAGATVFASFYTAEHSQNIRRAVADKNGAFSFDVPAVRNYFVVAYQKGKGMAAFNEMDRQHAEMTLDPPRSLQIHVIDTAGKPLVHQKIEPTLLFVGGRYIDPPAELAQLLSGTTDSQGRVTIQNLADGVEVSYSVADDRYTKRLFDNEWRLGQGIGKRTQNRPEMLIAEAGCTLSGRVTVGGKPVSGLNVGGVGVDRSKPGGSGVYGGNFALTDSDGRFEMRRIPKCEFHVMVHLPEALAADWVVPGVEVSLSPNKPAKVLLDASHGAVILGKVLTADGRPARQASLVFSKDKLNETFLGGPRQIAMDGTFTLRLPAGTHQVGIQDDRQFRRQTITVNEGDTKQFLFEAPNPVHLTATVCRVVDSAGNPIVGATVRAKWKGTTAPFNAQFEYKTDGNGEATIKSTAEDAATLRVDAFRGNLFSDAEVRPDAGRAELRLHKVPLSSVEGVVTNTAGRPLSGVRVSIGVGGAVQFVGDPSGIGEAYQTTGPDGRYRFRGLYPGIAFTIMAYRNGYADAQPPLQHTVAGKTLEFPTIHLQSGHTIDGKVVDQHGNLVVGAEVSVDGVTRVADLSVRTDMHGKFHLDRIPGGAVRLNIVFGRNQERPFAATDTDEVYRMQITRPISD